MARSKKRQPFGAAAATAEKRTSSDGDFIGNFFRDRGVRETVESILIAIMLALLFRAFEAEAFIIPTGSMANSLYGEHIDVQCEKCNYWFQAGASNEDKDTQVVSVFCPICQHNLQLDRERNRPNYKVDHETYDGDRILANKFIYDFFDPQRWDVIIFKNPNNPKQNYIKRCIGLENEGVVIEYGDIYVYDLKNETVAQRRIARKPPQKMWHMLQMVDDTNYIADDLKKIGWPSRWQQRNTAKPTWSIDTSADHPVYRCQAAGNTPQWLSYRHFRPRWYEWDTSILRGKVPDRLKNGQGGELITDYYAYNHTQPYTQIIGNEPVFSQDKFEITSEDQLETRQFDVHLGMHWVGDLCVDSKIDIKSKSGSLLFELVEGGVHYQCKFDLESGRAFLSCNDDAVQFVDDENNKIDNIQSDKAIIKQAKKYEIRFANYDDRLSLWVNKRLVKFNGKPYVNYQRSGPVRPMDVSPKTPGSKGDLEPVRIGASGGAEVEISRLQVLRDIYYVATTNNYSGSTRSRLSFAEYEARYSPTEIREIMSTPKFWTSQAGLEFFDSRSPEDNLSKFEIPEGAYMPMGDNSPQSLDARLWYVGEGPSRVPAPPYVRRDLISGRAMLIYWPHSWNWPPFWPNFRRMRFIH